ncbi:MAG: CoA-binding protein [Balneolaceae bacterium]|nr:CoA-binding protein [Balneolaceae bacterium]
MDTLFRSAKTIAVIGCSSKKYRTSHHIAQYLIDSGYSILPVNPNEEEVFGTQSLPSIFDIPDDTEVHIMNIFRNKRYTLEQVEELVEWSEKTGQKPVIWTQQDVSTPEAKKLAESNGFRYVENRCIMVEHKMAV